MESRPILILGAMNNEIDYLIEKIENCKVTEKLVYSFFEGTINGYPIVLVRTAIGLVNATTATTLAIEKYNPIAIINEGTAGGITENRHKKDIIIGTEVFNINSYKTPYKELGEGSDSRDWDLMSFYEVGKTEFKMYEADNKLSQIAINLKERYKHGQIYEGIVASGDVWNREKDKLKYLSDKYNASCEDMELVAIYTVAKNYGIPALGIKIMSDNELIGEEYEPKVATYCQEFVYEFLCEIIKILV